MAEPTVSCPVDERDLFVHDGGGEADAGGMELLGMCDAPRRPASASELVKRLLHDGHCEGVTAVDMLRDALLGTSAKDLLHLLPQATQVAKVRSAFAERGVRVPDQGTALEAIKGDDASLKERVAMGALGCMDVELSHLAAVGVQLSEGGPCNLTDGQRAYLDNFVGLSSETLPLERDEFVGQSDLVHQHQHMVRSLQSKPGCVSFESVGVAAANAKRLHGRSDVRRSFASFESADGEVVSAGGLFVRLANLCLRRCVLLSADWAVCTPGEWLLQLRQLWRCAWALRRGGALYWVDSSVFSGTYNGSWDSRARNRCHATSRDGFERVTFGDAIRSATLGCDWGGLDEYLEECGGHVSRAEMVQWHSRAGHMAFLEVCAPASVLLLNTLGDAEVLQTLHFATSLELWESSFFNPMQKAAPPERGVCATWDGLVHRRPSVRYVVVLSLCYTTTGGAEASARRPPSSKPSMERSGPGAFRGAVALMCIEQPSGVDLHVVACFGVSETDKPSGMMGHALSGHELEAPLMELVEKGRSAMAGEVEFRRVRECLPPRIAWVTVVGAPEPLLSK